MSIPLICGNCEQKLSVADHLAGKRIQCPKCEAILEVVAEEPPPAPTVPEPEPPKPAALDDLSLAPAPADPDIPQLEPVLEKKATPPPPEPAAPPPEPVAPPPPVADADIPALEDESADSKEKKKKVTYVRCPGCGRDVSEETVLCVNCGHNFKTGAKVKGYELPDPDKWRKLFWKIVPPIIMVFVLAACGYGVWYGITQTDFLKVGDKMPSQNEAEPTKKGAKPPAAPAGNAPAPAKTEPAKPAAPAGEKK